MAEARFANLGKGWKGSDYSDNLSRIYWIERGRGRVHYRGREIVLRPGLLYLIPAGTVFSYGCDDRLDQHWVHFSATLFDGTPLFDLVDPEREVTPDNVKQTALWFRRLEALIHTRSPGDELEKTGILFLLLAPFLASVKPEMIVARRKARLRFRETLDYIDAHLSEPLRIRDLAQAAHLERTYFSRVFRQCLGIKPVEYIMRRRVERAKTCLWGSEDPLRAIAESLGFTDAFHFSKCFKRLTGMTPKDFRQLRQNSRT
ncbi:MAG: AraC family transcriptional regulator [bacterium]